MKDSRNILLLVVSLCLVGTWAYHIYDKNKYVQEPEAVTKKDTVAEELRINDSIRRRYAAMVSQLDSGRRAKDSAYAAHKTEGALIDSLQNEIYTILNNKVITKEDLRKAGEKIKELQEKMQASARQDSPVVSTEVKPPLPVTAAVVNEPKMKQEPKTAAKEKTEIAAAVLNSTGISLRAIYADSKDQTTTKADAAGYFIVSCQLQNNNVSFNDTEVYFVLTDPQGNVIQDDQWQAGMFLSKTSGRIPYSRKSSFSYTKAETKRITASIKPAEIVQGVYSFQVYHNGARIGKADLRLY